MTANALEMMEETVGMVRRYLPDLAVKPESRELKPGGTWCWLALPAPLGADYSFRLHEYGNGDKQISAALLHGKAEGSHFWYRSFEVTGYKSQKDQLKADFLEAVRIIMTCETQIEQRRGWLFWDLSCNYLEGGAWKRLGSMEILRGQVKLPEIQGDRAVYKSPPLGQVTLGHNP